jgi:hypothetical protein
MWWQLIKNQRVRIKIKVKVKAGINLNHILKEIDYKLKLIVKKLWILKKYQYRSLQERPNYWKVPKNE